MQSMGKEAVVMSKKINVVIWNEFRHEKADNAVGALIRQHYPDGLHKALADNLRIMDQTAFALCKENNMPIIVFDMNKVNNLYELMQGGNVGTVVSNK